MGSARSTRHRTTGRESARPDVAVESSLAERRFEAVAVILENDPVPAVDADVNRLRDLIASASAHGLEMAVISDADEAVVHAQRLGLPVGSHQAIMDRFWEQGVAPAQVLIVRELEALPAALKNQTARRVRGELPLVVQDPCWTLTLDSASPHLERAHEALTTLADGRLGTRGSTVLARYGADPSVLMSGVYKGDDDETHLLRGPMWNLVDAPQSEREPVRRVLDLHTGTLYERVGSNHHQVDAVSFSSLARPTTVALRATGAAPPGTRPLRAPYSASEEGEIDQCQWVRITEHPGSIAAAAGELARGTGHSRVLERVAAYEGSPNGVADEKLAARRARAAQELGFDQLLREHRRTWASRWEEADVTIDGDPELQLAVRLSLFHLMASAADDGEAAVGARGLSGRAYRGHVFWDTEVFVLPFLVATHPAAARAILEYRVRRLPAALEAARARGMEGARFPWESAHTGRDVTPDHGHDRHGEEIPILTGNLEEHIVSDVAWAAACYIDWTGDEQFANGPGLDLIVETARWWASRIEIDDLGRGHIRGVVGPDEYHVHVDDNAFTNVMARWNLRRAAVASAGFVDDDERHRWLEIAERIIDNFDAATGIYEQFTGFHALEPLLISQVSPQRPVAADIALGHERARAAQVVKQADVLMLHYLLPDDVEPGSLAANLDYYDPRTAHGSTLSPGVHAALLARAGRLTEAIDTLRMTARIDLDDIGHMTAGGLHLAAMGSVWRTLAYGFAGLRPTDGALAIDPMMPKAWSRLDLRVRFRGSRIRVKISHESIEASADGPASLRTPDGELVRLSSAPVRLYFEAAPERRMQ